MADTGGNGLGGIGGKSFIQAIINIPVSINALLMQLKAMFPSTAWTSSTTATAGAQTLPANPVGFFNVVDANGVARKIPYYNP